ncbi:MAG: hypothetical protein OEO77_15570, partial [Acidimicrobiia bacterium]|nr:hypothetical protein [Acidimicrobiia bacterium]
LTAGFGTGQHWAWSPDGSRVAFFSGDNGNETLYIRGIHETLPFAVADGIDTGEGWAWSPDSTRIAFVSLQDGDTDVYIAVVDARTSQNVSSDPWGSSRPRWSPNGNYIAYDVHREDSEGRYVDVYIAPASGGDAVNVTNDRSWSPGGAWSPDGSRFVFVTSRVGNDEIYVADGDGRNPVRLTINPANDRDPAWSPDGSQIAFSSGLEIHDESSAWVVVIPSRIYVMDADGSNRRAVTDGTIDPAPAPPSSSTYSLAHTGPTWSPDGSRLAIVVAKNYAGTALGRSFSVYVVDPTTGDPPAELWSHGGSWWLRWSPDSTRLAIVGSTVTGSTAVVLDADGSGAPVAVTGGFGISYPAWSTYGARLAYSTNTMSSSSNVYVASPDGTAPKNITGDLPGPHSFAAAWRPQPLGPVGLVDPSTGLWYLRDEWGVIDSFYYGNPGDLPFLGDWDGDGIETPGLYRQSDGYVYLRNTNTQGTADIKFFFGNPGDVPLAGDFNGDGFDTVSIYRPNEQRFYIINELGDNDDGLGAAEYGFLFGNPGDQPVVGDWDGDGVDEIGLHRASTGFFYYRNTLTTGIADAEFYFGDPGDRFVAGDWGNIDGRETPAVFRPSNTVVYFRHTLTQGAADSQFTWPEADATWIPVAGIYTD